jgi:hypothetical protein
VAGAAPKVDRARDLTRFDRTPASRARISPPGVGGICHAHGFAVISIAEGWAHSPTPARSSLFGRVTIRRAIPRSCNDCTQPKGRSFALVVAGSLPGQSEQRGARSLWNFYNCAAVPHSIFYVPIASVHGATRTGCHGDFPRRGCACRSIQASCSAHPARSSSMLDIILLAGGLAFFALSIAYAYGCDRL